MAKPNYAFAKRQKELAKQQKKEEKQKRKAEANGGADAPPQEAPTQPENKTAG
ncbi:MAG: hypothetical protein ACR2FI_00790 [Burkholderiales bacterium]|nr:hypothetical protein [Burkholderiales bacterium]